MTMTTTTSRRVQQPRGGDHSKTNTNTTPLLSRQQHQEPCAIVQKKRRHSNPAAIATPSSDNNDDDYCDPNNSNNHNNNNNGQLLPLLHRSNNHRHSKNSPASKRKKRKVLLYYYLISLLLLVALRLIILRSLHPHPHPHPNDNSLTNASNANNFTNPFIARYEHALLSNKLEPDLFIPLLYERDKLLCRRKHKSQLSRFRTRYFAQMVRTGLALRSKQRRKQQRDIHDGGSSKTVTNLADYDDGLPILVMDGDENGCNFQKHNIVFDAYAFPRLTWSDLSSKHTSTTTTIPRTTTTNATSTNQTRHHRHTTTSSSSCNTISMPSYETYKYYHRSHRTARDWERAFAVHDATYPWEAKIPKAVWRGSTTYEGSQYTGAELRDTPRGRLAVIGSERTDVMDVGFHKIIQQYAEERVELEKEFTMKRRMHPMDMMKYKAIIDIDGNNWSSRFGMLLCSNSIVIKIEPDFIEYFYGENGTVRPNIHYLPASLENITRVVSFAVDPKNDQQMKDMIREANNWCKHSLSEEGLARDSLLRLEAYAKALDLYRNGSWRTEWNVVKKRFKDAIDDFVDCDAWSIVDWFTFPMFAGL